MGWESRGNSRYYYRKQRVGERVVSEYIGFGEFTEVLAVLDELRRTRRQAERQAWRQERDGDSAVAREVDRLDDYVRVLTRAVLLTTGHHTHRGQWRQQRGRRQRDGE